MTHTASRTDPLPHVCVKVNGKEATFFLDTGAGEVALGCSPATR
jgi:predicted aspartyl protease